MAKSKNVLGFWKALGRFFKIRLVVGKKTPSFREAFRAFQRNPERRKEFRMNGRGSVVVVGEAFQDERRTLRHLRRARRATRRRERSLTEEMRGARARFEAIPLEVREGKMRSLDRQSRKRRPKKGLRITGNARRLRYKRYYY